MTQQKLKTILGVALAFACAARPALAQTQATTTHATQPSGGQDPSTAAMAQEASNPFGSSWALQLLQNNNWTEMPRGDGHTRVQSNLQFQPLLNLRLTEKQGLIIRPVVTMVNSVPHLDQSGQNARTAGFGDTVLAFALPRPLFGGRLMVGAGPTFIFPTASKDLLSQDTCHELPLEWSSRSCSPMKTCASDLRSIRWRRSPTCFCEASISPGTRSISSAGQIRVCGS